MIPKQQEGSADCLEEAVCGLLEWPHLDEFISWGVSCSSAFVSLSVEGHFGPFTEMCWSPLFVEGAAWNNPFVGKVPLQRQQRFHHPQHTSKLHVQECAFIWILKAVQLNGSLRCSLPDPFTQQPLTNSHFIIAESTRFYGLTPHYWMDAEWLSKAWQNKQSIFIEECSLFINLPEKISNWL